MGLPISTNLTTNRTVGRIKPILKIVIHTMESPQTSTTAESCAQYFKTTTRQASAHYCIDNNSIVQSVRESDTAWHCPGSNADGIGFEHAGYAAQTAAQWGSDYNRAMLDLSARLAADVAKRNGIPARWLTDAELRAGNVKGFHTHADATRAFGTAGGHTDPGPNFPRDAYIQAVARYMGQPNAAAASKPASAPQHIGNFLDAATIKLFQEKIKTDPDGVWGPKSDAALMVKAGYKPDGQIDTPSATVQTLQKYLNQFVGSKWCSYKKLDEDGLFGPATAAAVKLYLTVGKGAFTNMEKCYL